MSDETTSNSTPDSQPTPTSEGGALLEPIVTPDPWADNSSSSEAATISSAASGSAIEQPDKTEASEKSSSEEKSAKSVSAAKSNDRPRLPDAVQDNAGRSKFLGTNSGTSQSPPGTESDANKSEDRQREDLGGEPQDQERPFKYLPIEQLRKLHQSIVKDIGNLLAREEELADDEEAIQEQISISEGSHERKRKKELEKCRLERETCEIRRKKLQEELKEIAKELEQREVETVSYSVEELSVETLYRQGEMADDEIINTVLYTATFFKGLPPNDFKEVVSEFLEGRTGTVEVELLPKLEDRNTQKEVQGEPSTEPKTKLTKVSLNKRWQDSFYQGNRYLSACRLKARRENGIQVIDFTSSTLREGLVQYFQDEHPFFVDAQLKRVEKLLFHRSKLVADQAIWLLVEVAIAQREDWLLEIARKAPNLDGRLFLDRYADLIYQMQLGLEPSRSEAILIPFFRALLDVSQAAAFDVISRLLYRHLRSKLSFNISNAATQLMNWLRDIVDHGTPRQQSDVRFVLQLLLNQRDTCDYLYDFLEIWQTWLPEPELQYKDYKPSHKLALILMIEYCQETLVSLDINQYGKWPSEYILFKPLRDNSSSECTSRLYMLAKWLFHRSSNGQELALEALIVESDTAGMGGSTLLIGFIVAEWFAILYGLQKGKEPKPEAKKFARTLLKQIVLVTGRAEQRLLSDWWTELIDRFLEEAEEHDKNEDYELRKQFTTRRVLTKELKNIFRELQQENS